MKIQHSSNLFIGGVLYFPISREKCATFCIFLHYQVTHGITARQAGVTSGVPQGSINGPLLFVLYISYICDVCTSFMKLYADESKIYREIKSRQDVLSLQNDLNALFLWSKIWGMNFNISKCKLMSICRKVKTDFNYSIDNNILSRVTEFNGLGITITTKLSWFEKRFH